ncbi:hypothetical protein L1049_005090 [Liquidambar formosana]|uniref:J domain-containing protein n=1 Tax=Liquidambar formosana TaxID=63359 RepID=A0AAP0RQP2_LIQFO
MPWLMCYLGKMFKNQALEGWRLESHWEQIWKRWHPDRCSASGNSKFVEEAKKKFQAIQEAYSVLSDSDKRFMYDVGVYDDNDDDENEMGDFLNEMATMMSQTKPNEKGEESFEELQELFKEMFQVDMEGFSSTSEQAEHQRDSRKGKGARGGIPGGGGSKRRNGRKQKVSSGHDVSSNEYSGISA